MAGPHGADFLIGRELATGSLRSGLCERSPLFSGQFINDLVNVIACTAQENTRELVLLVRWKGPDALDGLFKKFCHGMIMHVVSARKKQKLLRPSCFVHNSKFMHSKHVRLYRLHKFTSAAAQLRRVNNGTDHFLHGASSSGKSTIAKTLQARIEKPFWHVSIDHLRDSGVVPMARFRNGDFRWAGARSAFFGGFHASLKAYADAGNNLILEHILDRDGLLETLTNQLAKHDVFFVAVHCPLKLLVEREAARGDRPMGSAKQDFETIHIGKIYDIELNSVEATEANVEKLLVAWRRDRRSSSFQTWPKAAVP